MYSAMESNASCLLHICNSSNSSLPNNFEKRNKISEEEVYYTIATLTVNVFLCPLALFGNLATLIAIWRTPSLHSSANTFLSSLAVSDFAVGLIAHPIFIARLSSIHVSANVTAPDILFVVFNILTIFLCCASFLSITAIGLDRLLALELHLRYQSTVTQFRVFWMITSIWIFSALFTSLQMWVTFLFSILLPPTLLTLLVINFVVYCRIYAVVRRHQFQIQQHHQGINDGNIFRVNRFKKSALNTFLVYILLLCCYIPFVAIILLQGWQASRSALNATGTIILLNSSLNPLVYCWRVREIRLAIKHIFRR